MSRKGCTIDTAILKYFHILKTVSILESKSQTAQKMLTLCKAF